MKIVLGSKPSRIGAIVVVVAVFVALATWTTRTYLANMVSRTVSYPNLQLASRLDPGNSDYHLSLGRMYQYSLTNISSDRAIAELRRAIELSPFSAQAWLDLGAAEEYQGKTNQAEACLRQADYLAPNIPGYQWAIANFFLLHGNTQEAFRHFKMVLAGDRRFEGVIFTTAWKASSDGGAILATVIPRDPGTELDYLDFLLGAKRYDDAQKVWARLASGSASFSAGRLGGYIDSLVGRHEPAEAYKVWDELRAKNLIPTTDEPTLQNLVINGDFEEPLLGMGFDWRVYPVGGVYVAVDQTTYHSGGHSLLIKFPGTQNFDYHAVYELVRVTPGRSYRLRGFAKAEGITTDSGPRLEVRDAYDSRLLAKFSDMVTGTTTGWTALSIDFTAGPKTDLVVVGVSRLQSEKIDNQIAGKVWVDDVRLTQATDELAGR